MIVAVTFSLIKPSESVCLIANVYGELRTDALSVGEIVNTLEVASSEMNDSNSVPEVPPEVKVSNTIYAVLQPSGELISTGLKVSTAFRLREISVIAYGSHSVS